VAARAAFMRAYGVPTACLQRAYSVLTYRCQQQVCTMRTSQFLRKESFMNNAITWFEIPTPHLDRAQAFYEAVLGQSMRREVMGPQCELAIFSYNQGTGVGGALMTGTAAAQPSGQGTVVYLDASPSLDAALERVVAQGGKITLPRQALPPGMGFFAHIHDLDGNRVGLHASN
jgi:uncharacterized protein